MAIPFTAESISNDIPTSEDIETDLELEDTSPALQKLVESGRYFGQTVPPVSV